MPSGKIEGELWGGRAKDWAELGDPTTKPLFQAMLDVSHVGRGTRFLDMGCGAGGACVLAEELGANVSGFDASANLVEIARERVPQADFRQGDIEEMPYEDGSFDVVFAANSVQYAENQEQAVREGLRVMSDGGKFVLGMWCEPERCDMSALFKAVAPGGPPPNAPPSLADRANLLGLLERAGGTVISDGEVLCPFVFATMDDAIRCVRSAGIMQMFEAKLGKDHLIQAIITSHEPFKQPDGTYRLDNWFRWVVCE